MKFESIKVQALFGLAWLKVISDTFWQVRTGSGVAIATFALLIPGVAGLVSVIFAKRTSN